ncbi:FIBA-like protein [Mya arenaria]|uniref:FIBA-like protein n=1 Tax=Mya arenaria TaxID=6604 RepID=A0ABY7G9S8_MYAAR|nr:FIBA-like protein [Mya arenaria]
MSSSSEVCGIWLNRHLVVTTTRYVSIWYPPMERGVNQPGSLYPYHNGMLFSTFDHDHDHWHYSNCAVLEHGAWWYNDCYYANLNGQYDVPGTHNPLGITYDAFM